ncbi:MAG TPA: glycosyltransferase family 9 protein [Chthoniobacteraceae bacterium]|jgi:heptosyltransferase-2|nr:glycosyltransferase family 9 protein [Chthoniobacteraceae bacterium]
MPSPTSPARPRLLVVELWGLGDLAFSTTFLRLAEREWDITLLGKPHAAALLAPTFPEIRHVACDAPWTAFRGKYRLHRWPWRELGGLLKTLRAARFDAAVSVRPDPRDHLLMRLAGARRRYGFPRRGSAALLNRPVARSRPKQHKVEDWRDLAAALGLAGSATSEPVLDHARHRSPRVDALLAGITPPILCFHPGARIPVRRWPEAYFAEIVRRLRAQFDFHLLLVPDPDGYGAALAPLADSVLPPLTIGELVDVLGRIDLLLCNDSGPAHLAAACGRPTIPIFGPTDPDWFRPWGERQKVIIRDICPLRPCFDYCQFPEPYCLTKLSPDEVWPELQAHVMELVARGVLPERLVKLRA